VSGEAAAVLAVTGRFAERKQSRLKVSHAFHSPAMDAMLEAFGEVAHSVVFHPPTMPLICGETGLVVDPAVLCTPEHWVRQVRGGVRFADAVVNAEALGVGLFVELGPQAVLCGMAAACVQEVSFVPTLRQGRGEAESFAQAAGVLWTAKASLDWARLLGDGPLTELPTTAFVRQRYWLEEQRPRLTRAVATVNGQLLGARVSSPFILHESLLDWDQLRGYEALHGRGGAMAVFELALAAARVFLPGRAVQIRDVVQCDALEIHPRAPRRVQVLVMPCSPTEARLSVYSVDPAATGETAWSTHLQALITGREQGPIADSPPAFDAEPATSLWRTRDVHAIRVGLRSGVEGSWWFRVALWDLGAAIRSLCHPSLLSSLAMAVAGCRGERPSGSPRVVGWSSAWLRMPLPDEVVAHLSACEPLPGEPPGLRFDAAVMDIRGTLLARIEQIEARWTDEPEREPRELDPDAVLEEVMQAMTPHEIACLGAEEDLHAAGMDSLMMIAVVNEVAKRLGLRPSIVAWLSEMTGSRSATRAELSRWFKQQLALPRSAADRVAPAAAQSEPIRPASGPEPLTGRYTDVFTSARPDVQLWSDAAGLGLETVSLGTDGPLTVLLPPFGCEISIWAPIMERLARTRRVVAVNPPGYGRSPFRSDLHHVDQLARGVLALMHAMSPDAPADVVGWSLGGFVAQVLAAAAPESVRTLSLVFTSDRPLVDPDSAVELEIIMIRLETDLSRCLASQPREVMTLVEQRDSRGRSAERRRSNAQVSHLLASFDHVERGRLITAPTLILAASEDLAIPEFHARRMHANIPGARLVVLADAGHYAPLFQSEQVVEHLIEHLERVATPDSTVVAAPRGLSS